LDSLQKNKTIGIIGYGELGEQFASFLKSDNTTNVLKFDDFLSSTENAFEFLDYINHLKHCDFLIALGYKHFEKKKNIVDEILELGGNLATIIHPSSFVNKNAVIEAGTFIYPMCNIDKGVVIGKSVVLNNSVVVSHDSVIGECSYLSPGVIVCGKVIIGNNVFIGAGTVISNDIIIGNNCVIGPNSLVTKSLPHGTNAIGNPLNVLKKPLILK
jgi:sugar O-acyltransferase (sialic acid O-acetyltransferase NeuD family)